MAWIILIVAGLFEVVWASLLDATKGFTRPAPTIGFLVTLAISMYLLSVATRSIPIGTAYAVWVGIGAGLTVAIGMLSGAEPVSVVRILLLLGLGACVIGLKLTH